MAQDDYKSIRIDLRPFGWGVRDVDVVPSEGKPGPDSVGTEEIKNEGVEMEDLSADVQEKINNPTVPPEAVSEAVNTAINETVKEASEEDVRGIVSNWTPDENPEPSE